MGRTIHILQIPFRVHIVDRNARPRHDVVEVIKQQVLPGLRPRCPYKIPEQNGKQEGIA